MKKPTNKAYGFLSGYYEDLAAADGYAEWAEYVVKEVGKYSTGKVGCDAACGSGYFTRALKRAGYSVYGSDASEEMLKEAEKRAISEGLSINFLRQDLKNFKAFGKLDFVTVINDGMNYLPDDAFVKSVRKICAALKDGGLLFFDVSSAYKLKKTIGNNLFAEDLDDLTILWFNTSTENKVKMDLTFFEKKGNVYERRDETHVQYIRSAEFIKDTLEMAGFKIEKISGHLGERLRENSERINFLAIKE